MPKLPSDLVARSITGLIFLVVMIGGITWSDTSLIVLFTLLVFLTSLEFARLGQFKFTSFYAGLNAVLFLLASNLSSDHYWMFLPIAIAQFAPSFMTDRSTWRELSLRALGIVLLPLSFYLLSTPEVRAFDRNGVLLFFILLWTSDTMAYVTGRLIGRTKLWERVSPKKTWEGFIGGALFACGVGYFWAESLAFNPLTAALMGLVIAIFGTLGDLLESSLKRGAGIKDSGGLLPGHGGFLDRFDGVMLAAPAVYLFLLIFNSL